MKKFAVLDANGYISEDYFTVHRQTKTTPVSQYMGGGFKESYEIVIKRNGQIVSTITSGFTGKIKFNLKKKQIDPPPIPFVVKVDPELPSGVTATVNVGGITETVVNSEETTITAPPDSKGTINVNLSGTDDTCNYQYLLYKGNKKVNFTTKKL